MVNAVLSLKGVMRCYHEMEQDLTILRDINLAIQPGEMVALVGPSGAGKTTLLQISGLLDRPTEGEVWLQGQPTNGASDDERTILRRDKLGFVYQFHHLLPELSALENVMFPLLLKGIQPKNAKDQAMHELTLLGVDHRAHHRPGKLSGGEKQRAAIARALVHKPQLILADEPTGNLDPDTADQVFDRFLSAMQQQKGTSLLIATHNLGLASRMHRTLRLEHGRLL